MEELIAKLREAILTIDEAQALETTQRLLDQGADPQSILDSGLTEALLELGRRWNEGKVFLPEVVVASQIFAKCNALVEPVLLAGGETKSGPLVLLATVKGDLHDLGKNIVGALLKTGAFTVKDLGRDVPTEKIIEETRQLKPRIIGLSALLSTTIPEQEKVIRKLEEAGLRADVKVMVGGAPVTSSWAEQIGADGYAPNAPEAVQVALDLTGASK
jgi:methanogenic corrinoid protein MtbC1